MQPRRRAGEGERGSGGAGESERGHGVPMRLDRVWRACCCLVPTTMHTDLLQSLLPPPTATRHRFRETHHFASLGS